MASFRKKTSSKNARDYLAFDVRKPKIPAIVAISQALGIGTRQVEAVGGKPEWSDLPPPTWCLYFQQVMVRRGGLEPPRDCSR